MNYLNLRCYKDVRSTCNEILSFNLNWNFSCLLPRSFHTFYQNKDTLKWLSLLQESGEERRKEKVISLRSVDGDVVRARGGAFLQHWCKPRKYKTCFGGAHSRGRKWYPVPHISMVMQILLDLILRLQHNYLRIPTFAVKLFYH